MSDVSPKYDPRPEALPFLLWARIWSQLVSDEERAEAWNVLDLPSSFEAEQEVYWTSFHIGVPGPPVPLLFHAALGLDGANVREDLMRVSNYLGLQMSGSRLPPDHLAAATEVFAMVIDRAEPMLTQELGRRYFLPWCSCAERKLAETAPSLRPLAQQFGKDIACAMQMQSAGV